MDLLHSTWFWVFIIAAPLVGAVSTLIRLARKSEPPVLPPGVVPPKWDDIAAGRGEAPRADDASDDSDRKDAR